MRNVIVELISKEHVFWFTGRNRFDTSPDQNVLPNFEITLQNLIIWTLVNNPIFLKNFKI